MTYGVVDDYGNILAEYDSRDAAERKLAEFVDEHPESGDELALIVIDDAGTTIELVPAESVQAHAHG